MAGFTEKIYDQLNELFGKGRDEIFQMEMPARLIEKGNYDYKGSDTIDAQQVKPQTVVDAEFRLADDMYSISRIVGGPNGQKVSSQYSSIINGLVPTIAEGAKHSKDLVEDQERICEWLTEPVPDWNPPANDILGDIPAEYSEAIPDKISPVKIDDNVSSLEVSATTVQASELVVKKAIAGPPKNLGGLATTKLVPRVDLYQKLLDAYEAERFRWADFKRKARPTGERATPENIDNYNRMLASFAPIVDAKLEGMWTMLVVRGQYHRVRRYIGYVDIESASELVQKAKENLRASMFRSIDDTQDVYPVYMQPSNWATYLSTKFKPQDLLSDEGVVRARLFDKQKERQLLLQKRNSLKSNTAEIATLEQKEMDARAAFTDAQTKLTTGYTDSAIQIIQLYFEVATNQVSNKIDALSSLPETGEELSQALKKARQPPVTDAQWKTLKDMQANVLRAQQNLMTSSETLSRASLGLALARGQDASTYMATLDMQIESLGIDIDYLKQTLSGSSNPLGVKMTAIGPDGVTKTEVSETTSVPTPEKIEIPVQEEGASVWQEFVVTCEASTSSSATLDKASVSRSSYDVGFWFGSASGSEEESKSESKKERSSSNMSIQVGCRVMKVVINRPWMNAGIFQRLSEFYFDSSGKISPADADKVKTSLAVPASGVAGADEASKVVLKEAGETLLPTWPVSFIVAKDVHIIMSGGKSFDSSEVADIQKKMDSGGGCLCFSTSKSEASSEHRTAAATSFESNRLSIKIPAPQIIGWISHFCPSDRSQISYKALEDAEFKSKIMDALNADIPTGGAGGLKRIEGPPVTAPPANTQVGVAAT